MKPSAVWPWRKVWFFAMVAIFGFLALDIMLGGRWDWLAEVGVYVMFYAMGRQHQTEAFGIRMIQFIKDRHTSEQERRP